MPNRVLVSLLKSFSSRDAANAAVGDAVEELAERSAGDREPLFPQLWLNVQLVRAILTAIAADVPRRLRSTGLIVRDAVRALRAAPGHSLFVMLVLATGATLATLTYSVVDAVMLRPLPVDHPEQLVNISTAKLEIEPGNGRATLKHVVTPDVFWRIHDDVRATQAIAAQERWDGEMIAVGGVRFEGSVTSATGDIFSLLRLSPAIGRLWTANDVARGETDVAVLGYGIWRDRFRSDPSILGRTVSLSQIHRSYTVIGVLSASSDHPEVRLTTSELWVPMPLPHTAEDHRFGITARLRPGVSTAQVADEVARLTDAPGWKPDVTPLLDGYVSAIRRWMLLALGAAALVMLIACANAANLMLTRSAARTQEMAVRASLGASRRQIATSVLVEGLLLSAGATAAALLLSIDGVRAAKAAVLRAVPWMFRASTIALNGRVFAAAIACAVVTGILFSIVPAWQTSRAPVSMLLKDSGGVSATTRRAWRSVFLVAEVATVVVLLTVSWLFVASLIRVNRVDLGIDTEHLLAVNPRLAFRTTVDDVRQRAARVPGVSAVAVSTGASTPLVGRAYGGAWITSKVQAVDAPTPPVDVLHYNVTHNYFDVAGIRFIRGGSWHSDATGGQSTIVLDERAARLLFGTDNALGRQVHEVDPDYPKGVFTVVGIVPHIHARGPEETDPPSAFFSLTSQANGKFANLLLRTTKPPDDVLPLATEALKPVGPDLAEPFVFVADRALTQITAQRRFNAELMSLFGLVGMLIGAAGVYAVMMSFVAQQTREIGVRVALGASPVRIQRGMLALASRHLLTGLAIGVPIAWWLSRGFTSLLFQVTPADLSVYVGVGSLLSAAALLAAWLPSRRAARVDPIVALRAE